MYKYLIIILFLGSCTIFKTYVRQDIGNNKLKSFVFTGYGKGTYSKPRVNTYLDELEQLNGNMASFLYTCYSHNKSSSNINCNSYNSLILSELDETISLAKKRNLLVSLRTYIDMEDSSWRCLWNPKDKKLIFANLKEHLIKVAKFAEKRKLELLIIGAEYCQLTKKIYHHYWVDIISEIRKVFKGKLTYGSNWGDHEGATEWMEISFWKYLDYIGIDHYMPVPNQIPKSDIGDYQKIQLNKYDRFAKKIGKPLLFTEMGFPGADQGNTKPYEWRLQGKSNEKKQAIYYKSSLLAMKSLELNDGIFIWRKLSTDVNEMIRYKKEALGYELYKRKAWYEIKNFFSHF